MVPWSGLQVVGICACKIGCGSPNKYHFVSASRKCILGIWYRWSLVRAPWGFLIRTLNCGLPFSPRFENVWRYGGEVFIASCGLIPHGRFLFANSAANLTFPLPLWFVQDLQRVVFVVDILHDVSHTLFPEVDGFWNWSMVIHGDPFKNHWWFFDLLKFVDPLVPHSYFFQVWKTTAANLGCHQQPGSSITWPSCGNTWGLWALPWPMPVRDPREWLEWHWLVFFQGKPLRASFFTPIFLELVCPDIKLLVSLREASCFLVPISSAEVGKRSKPSLTRERIREHELTTVGGGKETGWKMS